MSDPFSLSAEPYKLAGVDLHRANLVVDIARQAAQRTPALHALSRIGGFSGAFTLPPGYQQPVLLAACDGVGTKLKLAELTGIHQTIGQDLVAMSVNDLLTNGGRPLVFLDYMASCHIDTDRLTDVLQGIADGCAQAGCTLLGGETAEMPGMYERGSYDLAGFAIGVVEQSRMLPRKSVIQPGCHLIGLASTGFHSNGYSLVRKVLASTYPHPEQLSTMLRQPLQGHDEGLSLADWLMTPTRIYVEPLLTLLQQQPDAIYAMAHITGGGFYDNIPRVLPDHLGAHLTIGPMPPLFSWLQQQGNFSNESMWHTFNCGIGMILVVTPDIAEAQQLCTMLPAEWKPRLIGRVASEPGIHISPSSLIN